MDSWSIRLDVYVLFKNPFLLIIKNAFERSSQELSENVIALIVTSGGDTLEPREPTETRPWGEFYVLDEGPGFKVKRILIRPGGILSLQRHKHRAERWTVVSGVATVTVGSVVSELVIGDAVVIGKGEIHRVGNFAQDIAQIIEVQIGDYLGEDDIERFEDAYGRTSDS